MLNSSNRYQERIGLARQILADEGVDALIIPSADPHMSEYLPKYWQGRAWVSVQIFDNKSKSVTN